MANNEAKVDDEVWKKFLRRHWKMTLIIIAGISVAIIGGLLLFLYFILPNGQATFLFPTDLDKWTMGYVVTFILNVIFWEFIIIGIPVIAATAVIILQWWNKLPDDEREEYQREPRKRGPRRIMTASSGGGIIWFLVFLTWCILIYMHGNWNTAFASWTLDYLVNTWISAVLWDLLIFGIPVILILIWWLRREMKEPP